MKRIAMVTGALALAATTAQADDSLLGGLGGILAPAQNQVKARAFDSAVESQVPGAAALTDNLSDEQKAQLFDYGVQNAGTVGQSGVLGGGAGGGTAGALGALGAAALGTGAVTQQPAYQQPQVYGQQPAYQQPAYGQPTYQQPQVYGQQPAYQQPAYQQPQGYAPQPTYQQPQAYQQPQVYGQQPTYQQPQVYGQPPVPVYGAPQGYGAATGVAPQPVAPAAPVEQSGFSYDPSTGKVSVGADTIGNALGAIVK